MLECSVFCFPHLACLCDVSLNLVLGLMMMTAVFFDDAEI